MIQEIHIDNYKSLVNTTVHPSNLNLVIGLNNSGKTNFCQALRFVSRSASDALDDTAEVVSNGRFGITNFYLKKSEIEFRLVVSLHFEGEETLYEYSLKIAVPELNARDSSLKVASEILRIKSESVNGALIDNTGERVLLLNESDHSTVETSAPREATMLNRLYEHRSNPRANRFKQYLRSWQYYDLSPSSLRLPNHKPNQSILNPNGDNLSSVIYNLKTTNERKYRELLSFVSKFDPSIDIINFQVPSEDNIFMFFEDQRQNLLPGWTASSGTLRFIALSYVLLCQRHEDMNTLIIIEEPENGVYVGFLKQIIQAAKSLAQSAQIIFTSHSPYVIDLFDGDIESILLFKRETEYSKIVRPNADEVRKRLREFPLGEQHFREMFG